MEFQVKYMAYFLFLKNRRPRMVLVLHKNAQF